MTTEIAEARKRESELIEKAIKGDESSFEALILSCKKKAWSMSLQYMRNETDAMDALQESFIKIFRNLKNFKGDCSFDTWVYRITVNTCKDLIRRSERHRQNEVYYTDSEDEGYIRELPSADPSPEDEVSTRETAEELLRCLDRLPDFHREIIVLRDIQNLSYEEIALIMSVNLGTVKSRISRARQGLREIWVEQKYGENV